VIYVLSVIAAVKNGAEFTKMVDLGGHPDLAEMAHPSAPAKSMRAARMKFQDGSAID
jgi:hypothetical protein